MAGAVGRIHSFVALGDSLTEGMCDEALSSQGIYSGWADRLALILAYALPDRKQPFQYANLAVRSKRVSDVIESQLPKALELKPDLVSVLAGANDLARVGADPDRLTEQMEQLVQSLVANGSRVLLSTNFDPQYRFLKRLRHRAAIYNANLWSLAKKYDLVMLDFWGMKEFRDKSHWAQDRVHLSSKGHRTLAYRAAEVLGVRNANALSDLEMLMHENPDLDDTQSGNIAWLWHHVRPWMIRRIQGKTAGDGRSSKHSDYIVFQQSVANPAKVNRQVLPAVSAGILNEKSGASI